jgi:hypothetical protein
MTSMKPKQTIRRFDVFAEYRKQEEQEKGISEEVAKGYGLWVAKVVASRKFGGADRAGSQAAQASSQTGAADDRPPMVDGKWHVLSGEVQTAQRFNREIVQRMGEEFYRSVFAPAIRGAREQGKSYQQIRDSLRREWKPEPIKGAA